MADSFQVVKNQSWGGRILESIKGILVGILLIGLSIAGLFWNEGRAVRRERALNEGQGIVVSVEAGKVEPANDGKLVHLSGEAETEEVLRDPDFSVSANAIKLLRTAKMYQWEEEEERETKSNTGGSETTTITYNYRKAWSEQLIDSKRFAKPEGHENPVSMPYESKLFTATKVGLGAFELGEGLVGKLNNFQPLAVELPPSASLGLTPSAGSGQVPSAAPASAPVVIAPSEPVPQEPPQAESTSVPEPLPETPAATEAPPPSAQPAPADVPPDAPPSGNPGSPAVPLATNLVTGLTDFNVVAERLPAEEPPSLVPDILEPIEPARLAVGGLDPAPAALKAHQGGYYIGGNPAAPEIGDVQVSFEIVPASTVSVIARQSGGKLTPYSTTGGEPLEELRLGVLTAEEMFQKALQENVLFTWILRVAGCLVMCIGFTLLFRPLAVLADVVPLLGSLVGIGAFLISLLLSLTLSALTIAVAWLFYRPLIGIALLVVGGLFAAATVWTIVKNRRVARVPGPAPLPQQ
jgi:hypothetical protein